MTAVARKAFSSVVQFSVDVWHRVVPSKPAEEPRVGEYYADYSAPTPEELNTPQPELDELFKNSKPISRKP